jgi:hypothetical protein
MMFTRPGERAMKVAGWEYALEKASRREFQRGAWVRTAEAG